MFQVWVGSLTMAMVGLMATYMSRISDGPGAPWSIGTSLWLSVFLVATALLVEMTVSVCLGREGIVRGWVRRRQR